MVSALYAPIMIFIVLAIIMSVAMIIINKFLAKFKPYMAKNSPYECGFEEFSNARIKFDIKYYLIAIMFILFDLEIAFLLPWSLICKQLGIYGLSVMFIFLLILITGFIYIWKKGGLEWE